MDGCIPKYCFISLGNTSKFIVYDSEPLWQHTYTLQTLPIMEKQSVPHVYISLIACCCAVRCDGPGPPSFTRK